MDGDKLELELNNLETGKKMKFRVKAKNEEGESDWLEGPSDPVTIKDPFDPPGPPGLPEVIDWTENSVKLKWAPPLRENGAPVTHLTHSLPPRQSSSPSVLRRQHRIAKMFHF